MNSLFSLDVINTIILHTHENVELQYLAGAGRFPIGVTSWNPKDNPSGETW